KAYKFALIAVFLWSTVATAFKITLRFLTPVELLFYSSLTSLFVLGAILLYQKRVGEVVVHIKNEPFLILLRGAINPFVYYLVLFKAYDLLPAQEAQAINYTWALMFAYLSVVFLGHKITKSDVLAGFICYFGVLIIATKGSPFSLHFGDIFGVGLALFSTILWSMYWIFNTKSKSNPIVGLFSNFLVGVVFISIYVFLKGGLRLPNLESLLGAVYVGFFEMGFSFVFWLKAVNYTRHISKISNLIFLSPVLSLFFIQFFIGEKILNSTIVALVFILGGLVVQKRFNAS
ncbi:MAG: DMT family transporter, partial [Epsilonproteobacteria bacterium]|nr:DMT family transporter [Campylobacterota bacterium]